VALARGSFTRAGCTAQSTSYPARTSGHASLGYARVLGIAQASLPAPIPCPLHTCSFQEGCRGGRHFPGGSLHAAIESSRAHKARLLIYMPRERSGRGSGSAASPSPLEDVERTSTVAESAVPRVRARVRLPPLSVCGLPAAVSAARPPTQKRGTSLVAT